MATKSKKTEEAVEKAKAVTAEAAEKVKAVADEAAKKGEAALKATKRTVKKAADTAAEKTAAVKKTAAEKKAKKADIATKVVIEIADNHVSSDVLVERAKADWTAKGNSLADVKELALYVNARESVVYYVVNDDYLSGSFAF